MYEPRHACAECRPLRAQLRSVRLSLLDRGRKLSQRRYVSRRLGRQHREKWSVTPWHTFPSDQWVSLPGTALGLGGAGEQPENHMAAPVLRSALQPPRRYGRQPDAYIACPVQYRVLAPRLVAASSHESPLVCGWYHARSGPLLLDIEMATMGQQTPHAAFLRWPPRCWL